MGDEDFKVVRGDEGNIVKPPGEEIREILSSEELGIGIAEAKTEDAEPHYHEKTGEIYFVLQGKGKMDVGDETLDLGPRDLVYIPPGTMHRAYSDGEFESLVISVPPWREEDHYEA